MRPPIKAPTCENVNCLCKCFPGFIIQELRQLGATKAKLRMETSAEFCSIINNTGFAAPDARLEGPPLLLHSLKSAESRQSAVGMESQQSVMRGHEVAGVKAESSRSYRLIKKQDCKTSTEEIRRPGAEPSLGKAVWTMAAELQGWE